MGCEVTISASWINFYLFIRRSNYAFRPIVYLLIIAVIVLGLNSIESSPFITGTAIMYAILVSISDVLTTLRLEKYDRLCSDPKILSYKAGTVITVGNMFGIFLIINSILIILQVIISLLQLRLSSQSLVYLTFSLALIRDSFTFIHDMIDMLNTSICWGAGQDLEAPYLSRILGIKLKRANYHRDSLTTDYKFIIDDESMEV